MCDQYIAARSRQYVFGYAAQQEFFNHVRAVFIEHNEISTLFFLLNEDTWCGIAVGQNRAPVFAADVGIGGDLMQPGKGFLSRFGAIAVYYVFLYPCKTQLAFQGDCKGMHQNKFCLRRNRLRQADGVCLLYTSDAADE